MWYLHVFIFDESSMNQYGFIDISLNADLSNISDAIPPEIPRIGAEQIVSGSTWRFLTRPLVGHYVGWHQGALFSEGTYGKIYRAERMVVARREDGLFDVIEGPHDVVLKTVSGIDELSAYVAEALLHIIAWQTVQTVAPWSIPRPYEIFRDSQSVSLCMSYVNGRTLMSYMTRHWTTTSKIENSQTFLEIMGQVAFVLYHLQDQLCMNHRDLKINNVLIRKRAPVTLTIEDTALEINHEVTLIDFGFACVGKATILQAGSWFSDRDICCKVGRDIAQLVFCIHCYFSLSEYLTPATYAIVTRWMMIGGINVLNGFTKEGRPMKRGKPVYNTGIYEFLRRTSIDTSSCCPLTVFKDCCAA
jgi:serine/threonine protein kinase